MKITNNKISKLHFGKWLYKLKCDNVTCYAYNNGGRYSKKYKKLEKIRFAEWSQRLYEMEDIRVRRDYSTISIFANDLDLIKSLAKDNPWALELYIPASPEEAEFLEEFGRRKRVCNQYAHGKYRYKVIIKRSLSDATRKSFSEWICKYPTIKPSYSADRYLDRGYYSSNPYLFVEDEKTVTILSLFLGNHIKYIEEYVLRDTINTQAKENDNVSDEHTTEVHN